MSTATNRPDGSPEAAGAAAHLRISYSREEALNRARAWMADTYGNPKDLKDDQLDRFQERLGMLVEFVGTMFPCDPPNAQGSGTPEDKR